MSEANNSFEQILFGDGSSCRPASRWPRVAVDKLEGPTDQSVDPKETTDQRSCLSAQIEVCHQQAGKVAGFDELLRLSRSQRLTKQLSDLDNDSPA